MKQKFILVIVLAVLALFSSCTLEKRHYRKGFYFNRPGGAETTRVVRGEPAVVPAQAADGPVTAQQHAGDTAVALSGRDSVATNVERRLPAVFRENAVDEQPIDKKLPLETHSAPAPLEKDKQQAIGAGVAAGVFFVLGMTGLIIKGTTGPVGVFIAAAFICCLLCIILASFLYPRDPVVKQPKEPKGEMSQAGKIGIGLLIAVFAICVLIAGLFLSIFTSLFL